MPLADIRAGDIRSGRRGVKQSRATTVATAVVVEVIEDCDIQFEDPSI